MQNVLGILYGFVFGSANIIPGVSGGTMLVTFGCYDKVCGALALDIKEIKRNLKFLIFFAIGAAVGIVGFSNLISLLFDSFPTESYMFFMGLIIGSVPLIVRNATVKEKFRPVCAVPFVIALAAVVGLAVLEKYSGEQAIIDLQGGEHTVLFFAVLVLAAVLAAAAMIIPGVSGSFIMVLLGTYETVIGAVRDFDFAVLIPTAAGVIIGIVSGARLIRFLLKKHRLMVFSAILGLCAGSLYAIFPDGFGFNLDTLFGVIALAAGAAISFIVGKHTKTEE